MNRLGRWGSLLWHAAVKWADHRAPTRSAAIAFYSLTSLAPVSVLLVWIGAAAWERGSVRERLVEALNESVGVETASLVAAVMRDTTIPGGEALLPSVLAIIIFAFSATAVLTQLQGALRDIWETPPGRESQIVGFLRRKLIALLLIGAAGIVLLVSMAATAIVAGLTAPLEARLPLPLRGIGDVVVSTITLIALFTVVLRILPDADVTWRDAALGGAVTGLLHVVGQWLVGIYLGRTAIGSAYGAAASLVVFMTWIYYSSVVFLYGAEVTRALSPSNRS